MALENVGTAVDSPASVWNLCFEVVDCDMCNGKGYLGASVEARIVEAS